MKSAVLLLVTALLAEADPDARYRACMERIGQAPEAALAEAESWSREGGGALAGHCRGSALLALERFEEGAAQLDDLAKQMAGEAPPLAARLALQASQGWSAAGKADKALAAMDRAVSLTPGDTRLRIRRGRMYAMSGDRFEALDDFNAVIDAEPENAEALVLRASTYRQLDSLELALDDLTRALQASPDHPDALMERGLVRAIGGDIAGARADWERVLSVAPDSRAAQLSREYLDRLHRNNG